MKTLKVLIRETLINESDINWLIIHKISKSEPTNKDIEFSFIDGKERNDEPFKTSQGYMSLNTTSIVNRFKKIIVDLSEEFKSNTIALANLFIIISRASSKGNHEELFVSKFKRNLGKKKCGSIFLQLISSLNSDYYGHNYLANKKPSNTSDWLDLFLSAQYFHSISDPLIYTLLLVRDEGGRELDFTLIAPMNPLLRAVLISWYGFEIQIKKKRLNAVAGDVQELAFLSAVLLEGYNGEKNIPSWATKKLIALFIESNWTNIGNSVFNHVFGLSNRNKNSNELYKHLEKLISSILMEKLSRESEAVTRWIGELKFPNDFISLFAWFSIRKIDLNKIPKGNFSLILSQFIRELQIISKDLPKLLQSDSRIDPFNSSQFYEWKFQNTFAYLLLLFFKATDDDCKKLARVFFDFKTLFYGGWRANYLAKHFSEMILLIFLSAKNISKTNDEDFVPIQKILKTIGDTILIPYIHLAERDDEIWNPETENKTFGLDAGTRLVTTALLEIEKHETYHHYQDFIARIDSVKIATWPHDVI